MNTNTSADPWTAVIVLAVFVVFFFVTRMFWLWYFRVGEIVELLRSIDRHLANGSRPAQTKMHQPDPQSRTDVATVTCTKCGARQKVDGDTVFCNQCRERLVV